MKMRRMMIAGLAVALAAAGCSKEEESAPAPAPPPPEAQIAGGQPEMPASHPPIGEGQGMTGMEGMVGTVQRQVVVPEDVGETWQSVVLEVKDLDADAAEEVTVAIGDTTTVGDLQIQVEHFLPSFTMAAGSITSRSNETENPAAKIVVSENENELFSGWLFSMYPDAHPFQHAKYSVVLKDFKKAE